MRYQALSNEELLRVAEPESELEEILLSRLNEAADEIEELGDLVPACGPCQRDECASLADSAARLYGRIEYLEELLGEHKIKYDGQLDIAGDTR